MYVVFKKDLLLNDELHFKSGEQYDVIGETEEKYYVSYMKKNKNECSLIPKDFSDMDIFDGNATKRQINKKKKFEKLGKLAMSITVCDNEFDSKVCNKQECKNREFCTLKNKIASGLF